MSGIAAFILCVAGFAGTALAKGPHHRAVFDDEPTGVRRRTLRLAGSASFAVALGVAIAEFGVAYGLVVLAALANIAGLFVTVLLAWGDHHARLRLRASDTGRTGAVRSGDRIR